MNQNQNNNNIENNINYSEDFIYPTEEEDNAEMYFDISNQEVLVRLSTVLFASHKPKFYLAALLFAAGMDVGIYLGCENTLTDIAEKLGESKQNFSILIKKIRKEFNLQHVNTGKTDSAKQVYKNTNYRSKAKVKVKHNKYDQNNQ